MDSFASSIRVSPTGGITNDKILGLYLDYLARPERLELPTYWFEASRSIHLSYGRATAIIATRGPGTHVPARTQALDAPLRLLLQLKALSRNSNAQLCQLLRF